MRGCGAVSLIVLLLSWMALDDITTDNANEFPLEYTILVVAAMWFVALGVSLIAKRRVLAGISSLVAVGLGLAAQAHASRAFAMSSAQPRQGASNAPAACFDDSGLRRRRHRVWRRHVDPRWPDSGRDSAQ
jgi:hypothetical protein